MRSVLTFNYVGHWMNWLMCNDEAVTMVTRNNNSFTCANLCLKNMRNYPIPTNLTIDASYFYQFEDKCIKKYIYSSLHADRTTPYCIYTIHAFSCLPRNYPQFSESTRGRERLSRLQAVSSLCIYMMSMSLADTGQMTTHPRGLRMRIQ